MDQSASFSVRAAAARSTRTLGAVMRTVLFVLLGTFVGVIARAQGLTTRPVLMEVTVRITDSGECIVLKVPGPCEELGTRLKAIYAFSETQIALDPDVKAKLEVVEAAMKSLRAAGLTHFGFAARTRRDPDGT